MTREDKIRFVDDVAIRILQGYVSNAKASLHNHDKIAADCYDLARSMLATKTKENV